MVKKMLENEIISLWKILKGYLNKKKFQKQNNTFINK